MLRDFLGEHLGATTISRSAYQKQQEERLGTSQLTKVLTKVAVISEERTVENFILFLKEEVDIPKLEVVVKKLYQNNNYLYEGVTFGGALAFMKENIQHMVSLYLPHDRQELWVSVNQLEL